MTTVPTSAPPKFRLFAFIAADLQRQWFLEHGSTATPRHRWSIWVGIISPRFAPVLLSRIAHGLHLVGLNTLAKLVALSNFILFGIEIATRCPIGPGLLLPHTQGTVIGAWRVGANATIFQGVTLGAKEVDFSYQENTRPTIGDSVVIGSGAKVLGGLTIGSGCRIGANSVVLRSIPDGQLAVGVPARIVNTP